MTKKFDKKVIAIFIILSVLLAGYIVYTFVLHDDTVVDNNVSGNNVSDTEQANKTTDKFIRHEALVYNEQAFTDSDTDAAEAAPVQVIDDTPAETAAAFAVPEEFVYPDRYVVDNELDHLDEFALTCLFDNIRFYPGMRLRDICEDTYWDASEYETEFEPGQEEYIILQNSFFSCDDTKISGDKNITNGNIIVWVLNTSDHIQPAKDCTVYKYQFSFSDTFGNFNIKPSISYHNMNAWGSDFSKVDFGDYRSRDRIAPDVMRYTYGSTSKAHMCLDVSDKWGISGLTVCCNPKYVKQFETSVEDDTAEIWSEEDADQYYDEEMIDDGE